MSAGYDAQLQNSTSREVKQYTDLDLLGQVGPVQIYKTALTAGDALKNFTSQRGRFGV